MLRLAAPGRFAEAITAEIMRGRTVIITTEAMREPIAIITTAVMRRAVIITVMVTNNVVRAFIGGIVT
jgi:hypothetical protein